PDLPPLSLHDALPFCVQVVAAAASGPAMPARAVPGSGALVAQARVVEEARAPNARACPRARAACPTARPTRALSVDGPLCRFRVDRKSTRLNSSHVKI